MTNRRPPLDPIRLSVALARGNGCTCRFPETITAVIDGITHVTILHDDGCPLVEHTLPASSSPVGTRCSLCIAPATVRRFENYPGGGTTRPVYYCDFHDPRRGR